MVISEVGPPGFSEAATGNGSPGSAVARGGEGPEDGEEQGNTAENQCETIDPVVLSEAPIKTFSASLRLGSQGRCLSFVWGRVADAID
jgi:hypothetical protein